MNRIFIHLAACLLPFTASVALEVTIESEAFWQSRYVTEGTDNTSGKAFVGFSTDLVFHNESTGDWIAGFWGGNAFGDPFTERQLYALKAFNPGSWEIAAGITRVWYPRVGDPSSWEVVFEGTRPLGEAWELFFDGFYDFDDFNGGYVDLGVRYSWETGSNLTLEPLVALGLDFGYERDDRKLRPSNLLLGLEGSLPISDDTAIVMGLYHTHALSGLRAIDEPSETWGMIAVAFKH
jgi:hypothetical protein